jgi:hypothetical protein
MTAVDFFLFVWFLIIVYIVVGNYLNIAKVLPALGENWTFTPSAQLDQVDRYLLLLEKAKERPWFYLYLRHIRLIASTLGVLMALAALFAWIE